MAEQIVLNGSFNDNITPKLKKLSREIDKVVKSFDKLQKKLRPIAKEMGNLAAATERVTDSLKMQKSLIDQNARSWSNYKKEVGQAGAAQRRAFKGAPRGGTTAPRVPGPKGGGGGGGAVVGGAIAGGILSNMLANAIISGFQSGVKLLVAPFRQFGAAFGERIGDEMADIQSAGGMFAIDQKNKEGARLFKGFAEAREAQEDLNRSLAKSAAALPGATNDYVRAARGLTDTVMGAFQKDREAFGKLARELGAGEGASAQENLTKVLTKFTEQTVLLGLGGSRGGMPLTMLMEQLVTQEKVNVRGMKMRYAQLRQNPLLANVLEEAQAEINATAAGTAERFRVMIKSLQRALPEEVVNSMRMSMSGIMEAIRSAFLDPDTGLFGLGRELKLTVPKINEFGQFVDAQGKVVKNANEAVKDNTTVFKIIRETLGGFLLPLSELASFLPELFDPLQGIAEAFVELRQQSVMVLQKFTAYTNWFKQQEFPDAPQRGALAAFNKLLLSIGAIDEGEALSTAKLLETKGSDLAGIAKNIFTQLFNSDVMRQIGEALGRAIGSVFSSMASIISGAKDMTSAGPFAEGLKAGFDSAKGGEAIQTIFKSIISLILEGIYNLFKAAPLETSLLAAGVVGGPLLGAGVTQGVGALAGVAGPALSAALLSPAGIAAAVALTALVAKKTEKQRQQFSAGIATQATAMREQARETVNKGGLANDFQAFLGFAGSEFLQVFHDFVEGFGNIFVGLFDFVVGLFSDPAKVAEGIEKMFKGLWQLFTGIGHLIIGLLALVPALISGLGLAIKNLFLGIGKVIENMWANRPAWLGGTGGESSTPSATPNYNGRGRPMPLGQAISTEMKNKPPGSGLVIANTSETIIPANKGYYPAFSGFNGGGSINMGGVTIHVSGVNDPELIANEVADQILTSIRRASYAELDIT